jgi:peptide/nickel transport system substrate-binding protein
MNGLASAGDIVVAQSSDLRSNQPGVNRDGNTDSIMMHMVEGLVGYTESNQVKPLLAKDVVISADRLTYTFKLRPGIKFHNGKVLTADDVAWNWNRYMDPKTKWSCLPDFDGSSVVKVLGIKVVDPLTVSMNLDKPSAVFLSLMARPECGFTGIIAKESLNADGSFAKPIGTGPYKWDEWQRGKFVRMTKFDDYVSPTAGGKADGTVGSKRPLADGIKFMSIPDPSAIKAGLESGVLDLSDIAPDLMAELKANPKLQVVPARNNGKTLFVLQTRDKVLSNPAVRRAMAAALDLDQLVAAMSNGTVDANPSMMSMDSVFFSATQKKRIPYDVATAKKALAASGYKGEPITIIANKRGNVPSFPAAVIAQAMMQQVGLNIQIEVLDFATQVDRRRSGKFQVISQSVTPRMDPALMYRFFVGDKDKNASMMWDNPKAIDLMGVAYVESDQKKRQAIFDQFHELMLKDVPGIFMGDQVFVWAINRRLKGQTIWQGLPRLWEVSGAN